MSRRLLLEEAERRLGSVGRIKINRQVVEPNSRAVQFYGRSGYRIEPRSV